MVKQWTFPRCRRLSESTSGRQDQLRPLLQHIRHPHLQNPDSLDCEFFFFLFFVVCFRYNFNLLLYLSLWVAFFNTQLQGLCPHIMEFHKQNFENTKKVYEKHIITENHIYIWTTNGSIFFQIIIAKIPYIKLNFSAFFII